MDECDVAAMSHVSAMSHVTEVSHVAEVSHVSTIGNKGVDERQSQRAQRSIYSPRSSHRKSSYCHRKDSTSHLLTPRILVRRSTLQHPPINIQLWSLLSIH